MIKKMMGLLLYKRREKISIEKGIAENQYLWALAPFFVHHWRNSKREKKEKKIIN